MGQPRWEVYTAKDGGFRFRLISGNGEIVAVSESYTRKEDAQRGADTARRAARRARGYGET